VDRPVNVDEILAAAKESKISRTKSIQVEKEVEPTFDIGNLLINDLQPIKESEFKAGPGAYLAALARDNAQLLFNEIWKLPVSRVQDALVVKLPDCTTAIPREKPVPKPKPPTKWETYAKQKGIQNKKRGRMIWDEEAEAWKPRYGYKRGKDDTKEWCMEVPVNSDPYEDQFEKVDKAKKDDTKEWCMEVPVNSDPYEDQFEKVDKAKKERVAKNELQRLRNIAKNQKGGKGLIMSTQFKPSEKKDKDRVTQEIDVAKVSTASLGKFQDKLPKEKPNKKQGKKRKFESVTGSMSEEKSRSLEIWNKVNKPAPLNVTKAVNKQIATEQQAVSAAKQKKKGGSGKVKNKRFRDGKKPAMNLNAKGRTLGKGRKKK